MVTTILSGTPPVPAFPFRLFQARVRRLLNLAPDTKHIEWNIIDEGPLQFRAGQFVSALIPVGARTEIRPYSIASPPRGTPTFDSCLNRVQGGYVSNYLCDLTPGAIVNFKGPYGSFVLNRPIDRDLVLLATGTGVAPMRSMLLDLFANDARIAGEVWLIFGVRFAESLLYREEFEALQLAHEHFHFVPVLSRPSADWPGAQGHVQDQLRMLLKGRKDFQAYLCGVKAMVDEVRLILQTEFKLDRDQIRSEKFI